MIEAVIFDMDGLLIDSEPFWRQSHKAVLAQYGHEVTEDDVRAAAGKRTADQVMHWQERFGFTEPSIEDMTNAIVDGVKAAKAALMFCFAVPEEPYDRQLFEAAGADRIFKSLEEVTWQDIASLGQANIQEKI
jgi:beta-phosphoglucomutase-like phosphatase (HAD superfamily)